VATEPPPETIASLEDTTMTAAAPLNATTSLIQLDDLKKVFYTDEAMYTSVIGIKRMISTGDALTEWNLVMATAMLALDRLPGPVREEGSARWAASASSA